MKIYVASSWRNERQPEVVRALRAAGHEVYDFRNPTEGDHGFSWTQVDPTWHHDTLPTARQLVAALNHPIAERGFAFDRDALAWADACVMVQPCGRSAALELGWAAGAGKRTVVLLADGSEPELMLKLADKLCVSVEGVIAELRKCGTIGGAA